MNDDQRDMTPMNEDLAQRYPHDFGGAAPSQPSALPYGQATAGDARKMMPNDYPTGYPDQYGEAMPNGQRMMPNDYPARFGGVEPRRTPIPGCVKVLGGCLAVGLIGLLVLGCIFGSVAHAFFASPQISRTSAQDFSVTGVPLIRVHSDAGDVTAEPGSDNTVHVQVEKHAQAFPGNNGQSLLDAINVTMTQTGNTIDIEVQTSQDRRFWAASRLWSDIVIQTPASSNLDFTTAAGDITSDGISGTMSMTTDAGDIQINDGTLTSNSTFHSDAGNLKLESVTANANTTIRTNAGNVEFDGTLGHNVTFNVRTDAGNVDLTLPTDTAAHFKANTDAGDITIDSMWPIPVNKQDATASATGDLGTNPSDTITVSTNAGNVTVEPR